MSNHHSMKWFLTHWGQLAGAKERRRLKAEARQARYQESLSRGLMARAKAKFEVRLQLVLAFFCFVYVQFMVAVYLPWLLR